MGLFSDKDKAARAEYKAAKKALEDNAERELKAARKRGKKWIEEESDEYLRLNEAVGDAQKKLPWYLR